MEARDPTVDRELGHLSDQSFSADRERVQGEVTWYALRNTHCIIDNSQAISPDYGTSLQPARPRMSHPYFLLLTYCKVVHIQIRLQLTMRFYMLFIVSSCVCEWLVNEYFQN